MDIYECRSFVSWIRRSCDVTFSTGVREYSGCSRRMHLKTSLNLPHRFDRLDPKLAHEAELLGRTRRCRALLHGCVRTSV